MPKKFVLTRETYYSPKRPHLSQSQIKDYLKSPRLFKAKYIDKTIERKTTPAMQVGKAFDAFLSDPYEASLYRIKERGEKSPYALTEAEYTEASMKAEEVKRHKFWTVHPTRTLFQVPLEAAILRDGTFVTVKEAKRRKEEYVLVCGLLDRLDLMGTFALCSDFKSTNPNAMSSPRKWYFHALDAGYHYQFAMYRELIRVNYPEYIGKEIPCAHITACIEDGLAYAALFSIPTKTLDEALPDIVRAAWNIQDGWFPEEKLDWADVQLCDAS